MAVFSLTSSNGFSLPMYKINNSMLHLVQSNGVSHEQGKWEHFYTFMRLVGEGTWQTRLQIKAGFLVCARRCWSACVASENKWSFQRGGKKNKKKTQNIIIYFLETYFKYIIPRVERPKYLEFLLQRTMQFWHCWALIHWQSVSAGCWKPRRVTCVQVSSPVTFYIHCHE